MWDAAKTFVGIWIDPNKTIVGKGKTFVGSPRVCGAERRRSRSEAAAGMLRNAKRAESAWGRALARGGLRSAGGGQRAAAGFGGLQRGSAFGGRRADAFPSNVVAAAGSGTEGGEEPRRARAQRAAPPVGGGGH